MGDQVPGDLENFSTGSGVGIIQSFVCLNDSLQVLRKRVM